MLFLGENVLLSENREFLQKTFSASEQEYMTAYATLSSVACGSILYGYLKHRGSGPRWATFAKGGAPRPLRAASILLQCLGVAGFSQLVPKFQVPFEIELGAAEHIDNQKVDSPSRIVTGPALRVKRLGEDSDMSQAHGRDTNQGGVRFKPRCPMDFKAKPSSAEEVYGMDRVSRHANIWSLASVGVGTALLTPFFVESLFFAGPLALATVGTWHQDSRYRRGIGGSLSPEIEKKTSNLPFQALLLGQQDWSKLWDEFKGLNALVSSLFVVALHVR